MADKIVLSTAVGVGDSVAADDLGAVGKAQWIKLMDGTDGGTDVIPGTAASGLRVDPAAVSVADGGALPAKGVQVGGTDGSVFQVMSTDNAGRPNVNVNGTVPVSAAALPLPAGAATAAKQPALGTAGAASADVISVQGVASMTALKTDASATTQPVSAASLPLPTGASTAAKQPALGTAGAASADVLSVQGVASMTALKVDGSAVTQPVSGTVTATGPLTDTQLRATPVPVSGTVTASGPLTDTQLRASAVPVSLSTLPALVASSAAIGKLAANSGVDIGDVDVTSLPALPSGSNLIGRVQLDASTANGLDTFHLVSAATTNATNLKASAGKLHGWYIYNSNVAARKVAFHNTTGTPTAGASVHSAIVIPPTSAANVFSETGVTFGTGLAITTVTDLTDAGTTAVAANDLVINIYFK